jgi:hypothetical protein
MKKQLLILSTLFLVFCNTVFAQNEMESDSIAKLNQQLKLTQDSLAKVQQQNQTAPAQQPAQATTTKKDTRPFGQRFRFSMSGSFWANTSSVYFELSPMLSYYFPKTWSIGVGPTYIYSKDRKEDKSLNGFGGKVYGKADITRWLYAWTEYQGVNSQQLKIESVIPKKTTKEYEYVDSWFLSAGINIRFGRKSINLQALYDVLYKSEDSYLSSPWTYRIGFGF